MLGSVSLDLVRTGPSNMYHCRAFLCVSWAFLVVIGGETYIVILLTSHNNHISIRLSTKLCCLDIDVFIIVSFQVSRQKNLSLQTNTKYARIYADLKLFSRK